MIIDGTAIAKEIQGEIRQKISLLNARVPCLAVVLVGQHAPSVVYVKRKVQACENVGIRSIKIELPENSTETELLSEIQKLNSDPDVDGILVQLPLPKQINSSKIIQSISPEKDVDGLHPINAGKLLIGDSTGFVPCTPLGIQTLLLRSQVSLPGKHVVVIGRSNLVGKPMATLLMQNHPDANATVTITHSHTKELQKICLSADIIIAAIGRPCFLTAEMVPTGAVVIDVGINKVDSQIVGDVDFENVKLKASLITPVPGGVGPMTIAMLLSNTLKSYLLRSP